MHSMRFFLLMSALYIGIANSCNYDYECDSNCCSNQLCVSNTTCFFGKQKGDRCEKDSQCASGLCAGRQCDNKMCNNEYDCIYQCAGGMCTKYGSYSKKIGDKCSWDYECLYTCCSGERCLDWDTCYDFPWWWKYTLSLSGVIVFVTLVSIATFYIRKCWLKRKYR